MTPLKQIERWFVIIAQAVYTHKYAVVGLTLILTLIFALQAFKLKIDTRDETFFHADVPTMLAYNDFREQFGQDDTFMIALKPDYGLTPEFFKLLYRIHTDLEAKVPYLDDINSLVNGRILRARGDTLMVEALMAKPPETAAQRDQVLSLIARYPMFDRLLISPDRSMATILIRALAIKPAPEDDVMHGFEESNGPENVSGPTYLSNAENMQINAAITQVLKTYQNLGIQFYTAGTPIFAAERTQGIMDDLEDVTDSQYRIGRISLLAPFTDSVLYKDYADKIERYLNALFPGETVTLTGHMSLFIQITKNFIASMAKSYAMALVLITLLMILMLGSIRTGTMSIVANITPILMVFGLMGVLDIPLDMGTILIGSIVLGLVVDDTIHFLHHFRRAFSMSGDVQTAILETMFSTGRALVITSAVLCGGFFIYTLSFLSTNVRFGLLTGCAVIFALIADFFLVPALLVLVYGKNRKLQNQQGSIDKTTIPNLLGS